MSVAKVIEISATSDESFEDAIRQGLRRASESLQGVVGAWVKEQTVRIEDGEPVEWRVNMNVTFVLNEASDAASDESPRSPARRSAAKRGKRR